MHTRHQWSAVLAAACACAAVSAAPTAAGVPAARAAKTCAVPRYPGTGYFTSLTVARAGCSTGRRLAIAYYRCRTHHGPGGRCHRRVLGYSCREHRNSIPTEIDARVRCRRGSRRIVHTYQQDL